MTRREPTPGGGDKPRAEPEVNGEVRKAQPWILVATILGSSAAFISNSVVNVALPAIQADFGATVVDLQWVVNAYALLLGALILAGGSAGDHFGRSRVFVLGSGVFALGSLFSGLAPSVNILIAARVVQGLGGALMIPGSLAIISASFGPGQRGLAIGTWSGATAVATAVGPLLGGWLVDSFSWRPVFFILVPLVLAALAVAVWRVPESYGETRQSGLDWWGAALATAGLGALIYGLIESSNLGFGDLLVLGSLILGVVVLGLFVWVENRVRAPMLPLDVFRSRNFSGANILTLFLYFSLTGMFFFVPLNLIQVQGYSAVATGAAFLPFTVLLAVLSRWAGGLVDRYGAKGPLVIGPTIAAVGFALFALPGVGGSYWTTFFPAMTVLGLGMAVTVAPLTTTVMSAVPEQRVGVASGTNNAVSRVAGLFAVAILGIVVLAIFSSTLDAHLASLDIPPSAKQTITQQYQDLADVQVPASLDEQQRRAVEAAIDEAFVRGFRVAMLISSGLALLSALSAALLIEGGAVRRRHPSAGR
ncbi:MAG: MFS transporter [Chloroflexota bacterium]